MFESLSGMTPDEDWQGALALESVLEQLRPLSPALALIEAA